MEFQWKNKTFKKDITKYIKESKNPSKLHVEARQIIKEIFPFESIAEEFPLFGTRLFADFYIPSTNLIIEVHGKQHFVHNDHFYSSSMDFFKAKARDKKKYVWADENEIVIIELHYNNKKEWKNILEDR